MKITQEYMIGNAAIQIVNTGKKIRIVDVEKEAQRRKFLRRLCAAVATGILALASCFGVVAMQNTEAALDRQVYSLKGDIENLAHQNSIMEKQIENTAPDYKVVYQKAKKLGMRFPKKNEKHTYDIKKSTLVRIHEKKARK